MNPGVLFAFGAYASFSLCDAAIKALGDTSMSTFEISCFVALFTGVAMLFLKPRDERWSDIFRMNHPVLLMLRSICGLCAGVLGVVSLITIPFAESYAIIFMSPFLVMLLSVVVLRERLSWMSLVAIGLGFAGVVLAVRPGFRELELGHFTAAGAAFFVALSTILLRRIAGTEKRISLLMLPQLVTAVVCGAVMTTHYVPPSASDLGLMLVSGIFVAIAQLGLILAARLVPASAIGQAQFSQLIWAIALGALLFAEPPDLWSIAGVAVIIIAGLLTLSERRA
jgi:drug/metabolite transporter (DMT)-like permease